ncbi:DUF1049 domain-containing protein [Streptomyces sp. NPDC053048]|uniref:DUF1049 domain-containing protein n=1 Tax=Streptomyces sp. NPDC053048 TaxID=3365694 RepID=UPI0037CDF0B3
MSRTTKAPRAKGTRGGRLREAATAGRVVLLVVAVLAFVFIVENTRQVRIRLIVPEVLVPLWLALAAMLVIGWLLGRYVSLGRRR